MECSITRENIKRKAILLPCSHPVDLQCAKSQCDYPKDFLCSKCDPMKTLSNNPNLFPFYLIIKNKARRALANLNSVIQEDIKSKAIEAIKEEAFEMNRAKMEKFERGFDNSEILDVQFNKELYLCFSDVVLDMDDYNDDIFS